MRFHWQREQLETLGKVIDDDAVQEAALGILRRQVRTGEDSSAYLPRLAKLRACDSIRRDRSRRQHERAFAQASSSMTASTELYDDKLEHVRLLNWALGQLPPKQARLIVECRAGRRLHEIAARLGIPTGTVRTQHRRGLQRIRKLLASRILDND